MAIEEQAVAQHSEEERLTEELLDELLEAPSPDAFIDEAALPERSRTLSAAFKTSAFVLNTLSKSEKYGKQIFTQAESVNLSSMPS